jgi:hypothetical protein
MNFPSWLKRLIAAFVGGAFNSMAAIIIDPVAFNLSGQWRKTLGVAIAGGVLAVSGFLQRFPSPQDGATPSNPNQSNTEIK